MPFHKTLLFLVCGIAVLLHGVGFYVCHQAPIFSSWSSSRSLHLFLSTLQEKEERTQVLAEIFQKIQEAPPLEEFELADLSPESSQVPLLKLSSLETPLPKDFLTVSFPDLPDLQSEDTGDLPFLESKEMPNFKEDFSLPPFANFEIPGGEGYDSLGALISSEHFSLTVEYAPRVYRGDYVFKLTLQPKPGITFKRIRQNYFFLIDRSNSIPRALYTLNKQAVSYALDYLLPGDTFNILLFDDRVVKCCEKTLPWAPETVAFARAFLDAHGHGGMFAATELYASLGKIIPQDVSDQEVNTAILLSDGDTYLTLEKQRQTIGGWTSSNNGKVSLFCVASGTGNNLSLLELISSFNRGALVYAPSHTQVASRVTDLIASLQIPIGKDLVVTAVSTDKHCPIFLQPKNSRLPHLYQNRPFVIWGVANRLSDFTFFLQGRYYDRFFDIKKKICFQDAHLGTLNLERQWAQVAAQEFYERFFRDGRRSHLEEARQFLAPLDVPFPFEKQK